MLNRDSSSSAARKIWDHPWGVSIGIHSLFLLAGLGLWAAQNSSRHSKTPTLFQEIVVVSQAPPVVSFPDKATPTPPPPPTPQVVREVFGSSRQALKSESGLSVKTGNTLAKESDSEVLEDTDLDALPVPQDAFLVTQMPRVRKEFRAPYPRGARARGVEGVVRLKILIDADGRVRSVKLLSGPDPELNAAATEALWKFEFEAARVEAQAVAVEIPYNYTFSLE
jgi:protein TonB